MRKKRTCKKALGQLFLRKIAPRGKFFSGVIVCIPAESIMRFIIESNSDNNDLLSKDVKQPKDTSMHYKNVKNSRFL